MTTYYTRDNFRKETKARKTKEHEERVANWQRLSPGEQMRQLDARFGEGQGAKKQRARIQKRVMDALTDA